MPSRFMSPSRHAPGLHLCWRHASAEIAVIQLHSLAFGPFAEVEPLNPRFIAGHRKLRLTVDAHADPPGSDDQLLQQLQIAFPGMIQHRCQKHGGPSPSGGGAKGIVLLENESAANQAHLLEHLLLEMISLVDRLPRLSGVTCAYVSPPDRNDVFVECTESETGELTSLLGINAINAALAGTPLTPLYPDALLCARAVLHSPSAERWIPARLARCANIEARRAASVLALFCRAGIAEEEDYAMNFSGELHYRILGARRAIAQRAG